MERIRAVGFVLIAFLAGAVAFAQPCVVEVEPNDTPSSATPLEHASCFEGEMSGQDQDAFAWTVTDDAALTRFQVRISGLSGQLTKVDIFRVTFTEDGDGVSSVDNLFTFGTRDGSEAVSDPFMIPAGTYVLGVSKSGGSGAYSVAIEPVSDLTETRVDQPERVAGAFSAYGIVQEVSGFDWVVDEADASTSWQVRFDGAVGEDATVVLADPSGAVVREARLTGPDPVIIDGLGVVAGTYRVEVATTTDAAFPFAVTATPTAAGADGREVEPNDTVDQANELPTDSPTSGSLTDGDVDRYTFVVDATLAEQVFDIGVDTDATVTVSLTNQDGEVLQERTGAGGALRSLRLPEGEYRFAIEGGPGAYELSFRATGSPVAGQEEEPNDTPAAAFTMDDSLTMRGELVFRDVDMYRFEIPGEGGRYRIQVLARDEGVAAVAVTTVDGSPVERASVGAGERRIRLDDVPLPPGTYFLRIEGETTEYAVRFLDLGELAARPPDLEAEASGQDEPIEVETVVPDAPLEGPQPARPAEEPPPDAPAAEPAADAAPPEGTCVSPMDAIDGTVGERASVAYGAEPAYLCGETLNVIVEGDRLQLDPEAAAFRFIWVAASQRGTVIKIDTDTGEILGEYWTAPVYDPERPSMNPSRTVIDRNGNAWVGNRDDAFEDMGSVVQVGLLENGQCEDRNGDGEITTSTGLGDVLDWTNEGDADRAGGVSTAADECILQYVRVNATGVRFLSVDADNGVWVTGTGRRFLDRLDAKTGEITRTVPDMYCGGYGGVIDREGILWSARGMLRWDPDDPFDREHATCGMSGAYGVGLGPDDEVWVSDFRHSVCLLDRETGEAVRCHSAGEDVSSSRGVAVTDDRHVWVVHSSGGAATRFAPDGEIVARIAVGSTPTGVAVDARGKVWVMNRSSSNVVRIDPASNEVDLTVGLGGRGDPDELPFYDIASPYTYSDMTGQLVFGPPESGTWQIAVPGPSFRTTWHEVRYRADVPEGASVEVRVSARERVEGGSGRAIASGEELELQGPYLNVQITMERAPDGSTPSLSDLDIDFTPQPLAPGTIAIAARPELVANSNAVEVILDASGSMGQLLPSGASRMEAAKAVLMQLADTAFPVGVPLALRVFGHLEPTTCHQSLELPLEPFEAERFKQVVAAIEPKLLSGTPLGESIALAGENLAQSEGQKMVVLVTDGEESCDGDPLAAIEQLRAAGVDTVNIVGFALEDEAVKETFRAWAEIGGGRYLDAASGEELGAALLEVLQPEFVVFDGSGEEVARGRVNDEPIEIPSGLYDVRVLSVPEKRIEGVRVVEQDVRLTVRLREGGTE